tara:strand:- start:38 stop:292 length:255 start_codon:yes stop_codon:yes gene_type:complete
MLGLGFSIPKLRVSGLVAWLNAFIKRVKGDGGTVEGKKCVEADGEFLINNTRAGITSTLWVNMLLPTVVKAWKLGHVQHRLLTI